MPGESPTALVEHLSTTIDRELGRLLERDSEVALVNYPNIGNVGDSAIWLGGVMALRRLGVHVAYRCDTSTYRRQVLAAAVGERGTILINGGGNLGDVYKLQQPVRERVLRHFPHAHVIQLPQSVWFRNKKRMARFGRLCSAHENFTLMVRERRSLEIARDGLGVDALLCPDLAFALGPLERPDPPRADVMWLMRDDREGIVGPPPGLNGNEQRNWPTTSEQREGKHGLGLRLAVALNSILSDPIAGGSRLSRLLWRPAAATFEPISRRRVRVGSRVLSRGRVVVTDRLHGHILATLLGIPNVVLDNRSGKSRSVYDTWTAPCGSVRFAESVEEAAAVSRELLAEVHEPGPSRANG